ncbi:MAG: nucleotide modification associated domain-containing protein [bacterium]|nr:nucleotide modification associated domain-containing protein [bacterium]
MRNECPDCGNEVYDFTRPGDTKEDLHCFGCGWESITKTERQKYDALFKGVLDQVYQLARGGGGKTDDYGETWTRTGLVGIYIKLMIKEGRLRELVWKGKQPKVKGESVRDTLMDIAAYAVYGVICHDEGNYDGEQSRREHLQSMLSKIKEELSNGED